MFLKNQASLEGDKTSSNNMMQASGLSGNEIHQVNQVDSDEKFNASDIDLNDSYSDDDDKVPIEDKKLWDYLQKLEENNLFEMNLLQENQQTLEKMEKESRDVIAARRAKINDIDKNILMLQDSHTSRQDSLTYYKNMLDSNNQRHGGAAAAKGNAGAVGRASGFS